MTRFLLNQRFRYEYSAPVRHLDHRLVVVPPAVHGHQRRVSHRLEVEGASVRTTWRRDRFGNAVARVRAAEVAEAVEFVVDVVAESEDRPVPALLPAAALLATAHRRPTRLTTPDAAIEDLARGLVGRAGAASPMALAEAVTSAVHSAVRYSYGVTGVGTTAPEVLAGGAGVCQDHAHVMLAVARACGLPTRYVSGHLAGEGGTHAWVEVLVPDPDDPRLAAAVAFDPTHDRRTTGRYLTVATGRDYADVAPTSGTFCSPAVGRLSCRKRLEVVDCGEPALGTGAGIAAPGRSAR